MEKNEISRIPDPDDPNDPVMPTDNANSYIGSNVGSAEVDFIERGNKIDLASSSDMVFTCTNRNTIRGSKVHDKVQLFWRNKELKNDRRWNRPMATATVAAVILLVLTFIQAVYSFL